MKVKVTELKLNDTMELIYDNDSKVQCYNCSHTIFTIKSKDYVEKYASDMVDIIYKNKDPISFVCENCNKISFISIRYAFQGYANTKVKIII